MEEFPQSLLSRTIELETGPGIYQKMELFDMMFTDRQFSSAETFFVLDYGVSDGEPFVCTGDSLRTCVADCPSFVFDEDVLFVCPTARLISCFHHEGAYWHIDCQRETIEGV
jgi:hypothetical protein